MGKINLHIKNRVQDIAKAVCEKNASDGDAWYMLKICLDRVEAVEYRRDHTHKSYVWDFPHGGDDPWLIQLEAAIKGVQ